MEVSGVEGFEYDLERGYSVPKIGEWYLSCEGPRRNKTPAQKKYQILKQLPPPPVVWRPIQGSAEGCKYKGRWVNKGRIGDFQEYMIVAVLDIGFVLGDNMIVTYQDLHENGWLFDDGSPCAVKTGGAR